MLSTIYSYQSGMGTPTPGLTPPDGTQNSSGGSSIGAMAGGGGGGLQQQQQNERGDLSSYNQVRVCINLFMEFECCHIFVSIFDD